MRIGELSRRTGVPVPTIKYYTREGLLPAGERISPNQVKYGEPHIHRLKLIRAMLEVGGLSVAAAHEVLAEVDSPGSTVHGLLGAAQSMVSRSFTGEGSEEERARAEDEVARLVRRQGWAVKPENPGWRTLVHIVMAYRDLGQGDLLDLLERYAQAAGELACAELDVLSRAPGTDGKIEAAVLGTVLGDTAMAALRRIAHEDASRRVASPSSGLSGIS